MRGMMALSLVAIALGGAAYFVLRAPNADSHAEGSLRADASGGFRPPLAQGNLAPMPRKKVLRVSADPNNLPFTNDKLEGFENKIAALIAEELGADLEYA